MNTFSSTHSYVIQNEICRTRYHVLYKAKNMVSGEFVTIKALEAKWLRNDEVRAELHKEASTSQNLNHPNICRTIAVFEEDYSIYKVQEYIEGKSLKAYLEEQRHSLSITFAIKIIRQILSALDYAHAQSVVHRNLNPDNILITDSDDIKIIGFGKPAIAWLKVESDRGIYHPAYYVSPEVYHGDTARASSDIYSVGVIAYALVCHRLPWSIEASNSILQQKQDSFKRPIQNPEFFGDKIPPWLFSIINKCLMVDKSLRIQSCAELISALQNERIYPFEPVTKIVEAKLPDDYQPPVSQLDQQVPEPEEASRPDPVAQVSAEPETEVWIEPEPENPPAFTSLIEDIAIRTPQESITDFDTYHTEQVTTDPSRSPVPTLPHEPEPEEITVSIPIPEPVNIPLPEPEMAPTPIPQRKSEPVYEQPLQPAKKFKIDQEDTGEEETMNHLKKVFTILMWLTLGVLVFIALKYYVFSDRPKIATPQKAAEEEQIDPQKLVPNELIEMVIVKADTVVVGSMRPDADPDEFPIKQLQVRAFMISPTEVTQRQWKMVYSTNPSRFVGDDLPVENVSFYDVIDFCNAKSLQDGLIPCYTYDNDRVVCDFNATGYRLPTEAEWEHAAKGGIKEYYLSFSGSDDPNAAGWFNDNSGASTNPVAAKKPNPLGLYDMSGNVFEWVWNWYSEYSYRMRDVYSGAETGTDKVIRGGSWYHSAHEMRVTNRSYAKPFSKTNYIGFRVVRSM